MSGLVWFYLYFIISFHSSQLRHFWQQNETPKFNKYIFGRAVGSQSYKHGVKGVRGKKYTHLIETERF
jgi:hypothetical protein